MLFFNKKLKLYARFIVWHTELMKLPMDGITLYKTYAWPVAAANEAVSN